MKIGAYSDLISPMKTPVLTSSPATAEVATSSRFSSSDVDSAAIRIFLLYGIRRHPDHHRVSDSHRIMSRRSCSNPCCHRRQAGGRHWGLGVCLLQRVDQRDHPRQRNAALGIAAFASCSGLTSVTIPASVISIGTGPFAGCSRLTSLVVDPGNPNYSSQDGVIYNKDKTALIQYPAGKPGGFTMPNSVTSIEPYAFAYCPGLTSVTIPDSVTSLGDEAFRNCGSLTSVSIGTTLRVLGS